MKDKIVEILNKAYGIGKQGNRIPFNTKKAEEIAHLYSAGEEVWNKEAIELVRRYIPNNALAKDYILELLTRPTVSEEEIDIEATFLINSNWNVSSGCKVMTYKDFKAAIKELLTR